MNPNSEFPLSPHWKPRDPSPAVRKRLFGVSREPALPSVIAAALRWLAPATACLCAIAISIAQYAPAAMLNDASQSSFVSASDTQGADLSGYIDESLADRLIPQNLANNRVASASGRILEWTNTDPITSTTRFLLQSFTNSAMF